MGKTKADNFANKRRSVLGKDFGDGKWVLLALSLGLTHATLFLR